MIRRKRAGRKRRIVAALSDIHSGARVGLLCPDVVLERESADGDVELWTPELITTQVELWKAYQQNIESLKAFAGDDEIVVLHCGDATQGHQFNALVPDVTEDDQRTIAAANLMPLVGLPNVKKVRLVTGTPVHVPNAAEAKIASALAKSTGKDIRSKHHLRGAFDGVVFDIAHHGPHPGTRDWLKGNVARYYLRDRIYIDRRSGTTPADVYLRGHFHELVHEPLRDRWNGCSRMHHLVIVPSFSGMTDFARKVTRTVPTLTTGIVAFEIVNGRLVDINDEFVQTWDLRVEEQL